MALLLDSDVVWTPIELEDLEETLAASRANPEGKGRRRFVLLHLLRSWGHHVLHSAEFGECYSPS